MPLWELSVDEIQTKLDYMRNSSGDPVRPHHKLTIGTTSSKIPSVQGLWKGQPDLWKDPIYNSPAREKDIEKMKILFRKMMDSLGQEGVMKVLQKMRRKESRTMQRMRSEKREKLAKVSRESLEGYYTKVYVPERIAEEKQKKLRVRKFSIQPCNSKTGATRVSMEDFCDMALLTERTEKKDPLTVAFKSA